ncbi:MAG: replication protein, partial [Chloroflexota bacterium]|nr:replication protein [Chloroflexota bacterium]
ELLIELSGAELKALLYIIRRTFGFKKDSDNISLSQMLNGITTREGQVLDRGAGLSKPTLLQALRSLQEKGIIETERQRSAEKGDEPTLYRLKFAGETRGQKNIAPVVKEFDQGGDKETLPGPWLENLTTQNTAEQKTVEQDIYNSNPRKANRENEHYVNQSTVITTPTSSRSKAQVGERVHPRSSATQQRTLYNVEYDNELNLEAEKERSNHRNQRPGTKGGIVKISTMLTDTPKPRRGRPAYDEDRRFFTDVMELVANELNDQANLKSTVTQLYNIFKKWQEATGGERYAFLDLVDQARAITKEHSGQIKKTDGGKGMPAKNRAPYFFAVLRDVAGLRDEDRAGVQRAD